MFLLLLLLLLFSSKIVERQRSLDKIKPLVDRRHFIFGDHEFRDRK